MNCRECDYALDFELIGFIVCDHPVIKESKKDPCFEGKTHPRWCPLKQNTDDNIDKNGK